MTSKEVWGRLKPLLKPALALAPEDRPAYLDTVLSGDDDLRAEADRLLKACDSAAGSLDFLESPAVELVAPLLELGPASPGAAGELPPGLAVGPYVLEKHLGAGGMGVVYLARDPRLDRRVALKMLPAWLPLDDASARRLTEEAKAASRLDHPNIQTVYEIGRTPDGRPFIAMAYYEGETLHDRVRRAPLDLREAWDLTRQIAQGLGAAHRHGIVHRDVKPGNVIITEQGLAKVLDFGAAMIVDHRLDRGSSVVGTVAYMSPEQARGEDVDARTDVWSLGVVMYEMLTGRRPFAGGDVESVLQAVCDEEPLSLRDRCPEAPAALVHVVERCLEKDRGARFEDAAAVAEALDSASVPSETGSLQRGRRAFEQGAWSEALALLRQAGEEAPLAGADLERMATAAFLRNDEAASEEYWGLAHLEHLRTGDLARAARCAMWAAFGLVNRGERAKGAGWIARAERALRDGPESCVERGYLLLPRGLKQMGEGDVEGARATLSSAVEIGERFADADLLAIARHGMGRALIRAGEIEAGIGLLDEVMVSVTTGEASALVAGDVYCGLLEACAEVHDLHRAQEWTAALSDWCAEHAQLLPYRGQCLVRRAELSQLRGAWAEALGEARRACDLLTREPSRPAAAAAFYRIAELHRLRGEFEEAEEAYRLGDQWGLDPEPGLARLRLAQGRVEAARGAITRALEEATVRRKRSHLLGAYVEIALEAGEVEAAAEAAEELRRISEELRSPLLRAEATTAAAAVAHSRGRPADARNLFREALRAWRGLGAPYEAARVRVSLAAVCRTLGDDDTADIELDAAMGAFRRLGAIYDRERAAGLRGAGPTPSSAVSHSQRMGRWWPVAPLIGVGVSVALLLTPGATSGPDVATDSTGTPTRVPVAPPVSVDPSGPEDPSVSVAPVVPAPRRLAVLPLVLSADGPDDEYLSQALTEELIADLHRIEGLDVATFGQARPYAHAVAGADLARVARGLGVEHVVLGSIRDDGDAVQLSIRLVDAASVWSHDYASSFSGLLSLKRRVVDDIARALFLTPPDRAAEPAAKWGVADPDALRAYWRGRRLLLMFQAPGFSRPALEHFDEALRRDSTFALAWAGLSGAYLELGLQGALAPAEAVPRARDAAERALVIDPEIPDAHTHLAAIHSWFDWDEGQADRHFRRALELDPRSAWARWFFAIHLRNHGQLLEALRQIRVGADLDPLSPNFYLHEGQVLSAMKRPREALAAYDQLLGIVPDHPLVPFYVALAHLQMGSSDRALSILESTDRELSGVDAGLRGYVLAKLGRRTEARSLLAELGGVPASGAALFSRASIHLGLGEPDEALELLELAADERACQLLMLAVDPAFDPLRAEPHRTRFEALLERVGLPTVIVGSP